MEVKRAIIHQIVKEQSVAPSLISSSSLLELNENILTLGFKLNEAFKKDEKVLKTEFIETQNVFQKELRNFVNLYDDNSFLKFSNDSIVRMIDLLTTNNLATGGYFVYLEYQYRNSNFVGVYIVRDEEELIFKRSSNDENFEVQPTTIVNTNKLAMAVRVMVDKINENRYLHFTKKQQYLAEYFFNWIEANLAPKSDDDTKKLIQLLMQLNAEDLPKKPESEERYNMDEIRTMVFDNIQSTGRIVRIKDLSQSLWNDREFLDDKCEEYDIHLSGEFQANYSILKKLKKYEISSGKIKLSFSQNDIDQGRVILGESNQIIIESEELVRKYNSELL